MTQHTPGPWNVLHSDEKGNIGIMGKISDSGKQYDGSCISWGMPGHILQHIDDSHCGKGVHSISRFDLALKGVWICTNCGAEIDADI